jgi:hypothetical protein
MTHPFLRMSAEWKIKVAMLGFGMAAVWGCSRGPAVQYVEGVVTLDGNPVEGAIVTFTPSGPGLGAAGTTDASGIYRLNALTGRAGAGTLAGDYLVAVRKWEYQDPGPAPDPGDQKAYAAWQERSMKAARREPTYITTKAYGDATTSGLKATVKKGRNTGDAFRFDLKSDFTGM